MVRLMIRQWPAFGARSQTVVGSLSRTVEKARLRREPLDLDLPERRVTLSEDGHVLGVQERERFDAHKLIEEFMIQANVCAAETLEQKKVRTAYIASTNHLPMKNSPHWDTSCPPLVCHGRRARVPLRSDFNKLLAQARLSEHEHLVSEMVLRTQSQARYAQENAGHFGLEPAPIRTLHFTHPPVFRSHCPPRANSSIGIRT